MNRIKIKIENTWESGLKILYRLKIDVYDVDYTEDGPVFTIALEDLDKLDAYQIKIISYKGLKNLFLKIYADRHFIFASLLSLAIITLLSFFCFDVTIVHSDKNIRALLEDELYDHGIRPFMLKKSFSEIQEIKKHIKDTYPNDIEWLEIEDAGMRYVVRVEERIITEEKNTQEFCNIVANRDATIYSITSSKGQTLVNTNDFVKKGDILISGKIKFNEEIKSYTCADGKVFGNTWYTVAVKVPLEHLEKTFTGQKKNNLSVEIGTTYTRIFKVHFDKFDVEKKPLFKFGSFAIYKETVKEYTETKKKYTPEEALEEAKKLGRDKLKTGLDKEATILDEKVLQSEEYDSIISVEFFYSVKEIISKVEIGEKGMDEELE